MDLCSLDYDEYESSPADATGRLLNDPQYYPTNYELVQQYYQSIKDTVEIRLLIQNNLDLCENQIEELRALL